MDAHRLRSVFDLIISEHARLGIDHKLAELLQALSVCVSSPSASSDERFRLALTELLTALRRARTNDFVESNRRILVEIQGEQITGNGLAERILDVVNDRPFLAARARERFVEIADYLQRRLGACAAARSSLEQLNVGPVMPDGGEYELGILLPDSLVRGDLARLLKELKEWNRTLRELVPVISSQPPKVTLRTFSAKRFELSARLDRAGALALGTIIARVYELFRNVQSNDEKAAELERKNYPPEIVSRLNEYEKLMMPQELKAIREVVTSKFLKSPGRRKEVDKLLDRCLQFLASRIRDGVAVEILGPPAPEAAATADERTPAGETGGAITHHVRAALQTASRTPAPPPAAPRDAPSPPARDQTRQLPTDDQQKAA